MKNSRVGSNLHTVNSTSIVIRIPTKQNSTLVQSRSTLFRSGRALLGAGASCNVHLFYIEQQQQHPTIHIRHHNRAACSAKNPKPSRYITGYYVALVFACVSCSNLRSLLYSSLYTSCVLRYSQYDANDCRPAIPAMTR